MRLTLPDFSFCLKSSISVLLITLISSCYNSRHTYIERPLPQTKIGNNANEVQLGDSKFYLKVPDNIKVIEARGKEGQHGFNILPKDTSSKMYGFIEVAHGHPIGDSSINECKNAEKAIQSIFLNVQVLWTICVTQTGYFNAKTNGYEGITAYAYSDKRKEVEDMISIIGTLTGK